MGSIIIIVLIALAFLFDVSALVVLYRVGVKEIAKAKEFKVVQVLLWLTLVILLSGLTLGCYYSFFI